MFCSAYLCREWRLIEVDATLEQLEPHRPHLLQLLVRPVMSRLSWSGFACTTRTTGSETLALTRICIHEMIQPISADHLHAAWQAPSETVMDLNIGSALWCAAHAAGRLRYPQLPAWRSAARHHAAPKTATGPGGSAENDDCAGTHTASAETAAAAGAVAEARAATGGGNALWRPAREGAHYRSCARVALLGHGADEQCGGYGRHRTTFRHQVHTAV
jgi:hypothetical protein